MLGLFSRVIKQYSREEMSKINARSPYYVESSSKNTDDISTLEIYFNGETTTPTYTLSSTHLEDSSNVYWEISALVKDYITHSNISNFPSVLYQTSTLCVGLKRDNDGAIVDYVAYDGYGYFEDGENPQLSSSYVLQTNDVVYVPDGGTSAMSITVPIDRSVAVNYEVFYESGESYSGTTVADTSCGGAIANLWVVGAPTYESRVTGQGGTVEYSPCFRVSDQELDSVDIKSIVVTEASGTRTIKVKKYPQMCDKHQQYQIYFINKYGALQSLNFSGKSTNNIEVKREKYKPNIVSGGQYNTYDHQYKNFFVNGKEKVTLNSGFVDENLGYAFEEMMLSEQCWIYSTSVGRNTGSFLPITIADSNLEFKKQANEKLINYTINVEMAFDRINNVR